MPSLKFFGRAKASLRIEGSSSQHHKKGLSCLSYIIGERTIVPTRWKIWSDYSQRNTFAESAVQATNTRTRAAMSPTWTDHASPFQIPWSSDTA
jgi:hypothetical protein